MRCLLKEIDSLGGLKRTSVVFVFGLGTVRASMSLLVLPAIGRAVEGSDWMDGWALSGWEVRE